MSDTIETKLNKLNVYRQRECLSIFGLCRNSREVTMDGSIIARYQSDMELEQWLDKELTIYEGH